MSSRNRSHKIDLGCHSEKMRLASKSDALWAAFISRVKDELAAGWGAQDRLAKRLGVTPGNIKKWVNGDIKTAKYQDMLRYMDALGIKLEDVFKEYKPENCGYGYVRKVQAKLGAGSSLVTNGDVSGLYAFRQDFLNTVGGNPDQLILFDVMGDSMEPTIPDKSTVLVDMRDTQPRDGMIYAVRVEDELLVKRIFRAPGKLICKSDNPRRGEVTIDGETPDFEIYGRVRWVATIM